MASFSSRDQLLLQRLKLLHASLSRSLPLEVAIEGVLHSPGPPKQRHFFARLLHGLRGGQSLAESMRRADPALPRIVFGLVAGWAPRNPMDDTPFGRELPLSAEAKTTPEGYTGKPLDLTFGLQAMNYGARFYDPRLGRWWQRDPHAERYPNLSPYQYCENNPLVFINNDGRDPSVKKLFKAVAEVKSARFEEAMAYAAEGTDSDMEQSVDAAREKGQRASKEMSENTPAFIDLLVLVGPNTPGKLLSTTASLLIATDCEVDATLAGVGSIVVDALGVVDPLLSGDRARFHYKLAELGSTVIETIAKADK